MSLPINDRRPLDWANTLFLVSTPLIAFTGTAWYVWHNGVTGLEVANFAGPRLPRFD